MESPKRKPFKGDESLEERIDRMMQGDDGEESDGDASDDLEEYVESWRDRRRREREEKRRREEEELRNINEYWYKDPNINVKVPRPDAPFEELGAALIDSRTRLEELKYAYCRSRRRQYKTITETYLHEIKRQVNAIEAIKDILAARSEDFRVNYRDREHPLEACRRIVLDCFVASALYGPEAFETDVLRRYRDERLAVSAPGRLFIRLYYRFLGPAGARLIRRYPLLHSFARSPVDRLVDHAIRSLGNRTPCPECHD